MAADVGQGAGTLACTLLATPRPTRLGKESASVSIHRRSRRVLAWLVLPGLLAGLAAGCDPQDRRPGLCLTGEVVEEPVEDWSFTQAHDEIFVETRTPWLVPHSVTTVMAVSEGMPYVPSIFRGEEGWPEGKRWTRNVVRDPRVRLEIGGRIYPRRAVLVTDPDERARVLDAFAAKYPHWQSLREMDPEERPHFVFIRMEPRRPHDDG